MSQEDVDISTANFAIADIVSASANFVTTSNAVRAAEGTEKRASPEAKRLRCHRFAKGAAISDGVIAPFVFKTTPEAGAAPLQSCLPWRGKLLHGSHRAIRRPDHTRIQSGSTADVSPKARQIAPRESSRHTASRPHQKPKRLHCTRVSHGAANDTSAARMNNFSELGSTFTKRQRGLPELTSWSTPTTRSSEQRRHHAANYGSDAGPGCNASCRYRIRHASQAKKSPSVQVA